jgi:hypothetical protein
MGVEEGKPLHNNNHYGIVYPRKIQVISSLETKMSQPSIVYNGGLLIERAEVFSIFWGKEWNEKLLNLRISLDDFFKVILNSEVIDQLAEYNTEKYIIKHGKYLGSNNVIDPMPASRRLNDIDIQHFLKKQIFTNSSIPKPTINMLYFIYLPPGIVSVVGTNISCNKEGEKPKMCAYHSNLFDPQAYYAVIPYPSCTDCFMGKQEDLDPLDAITALSSHELCEAITDPIVGSGWCDPSTFLEIGDICETELKNLGQYKIQREWSNQKNGCF